MQAREDAWQPFVVARQTAAARDPAERALDHPSSGQKHEFLLGLGEFDHFKLDAVRRRSLRRLRSSVTLVYPSQWHVFAGDFLHGFWQHAHLVAFLFIGGGDMQGQQMADHLSRNITAANVSP